MQITFLGTSSMVPTKERNVSGIFLEYRGEGILLDCGEGTQRQMNMTGIKRTSVKKVLLSHWHGDHVSGLIGLIQTLGNAEENARLMIFGPKGTKKRMEYMMNCAAFENKVELVIEELDPREGELLQFYETEEYLLECARLDHSTPCIGFAFTDKERLNIDTEKQKKLKVRDGPHLRRIKAGESIEFEGKKISPEMITYKVPMKKLAYVADTSPCDGALLLANEADILISECTYSEKLGMKGEQYKHMSAKDAALLANQANAKKLVLTHFSQRYTNTQEIEEDARNYFDDVICAEDFMKFKM